MVVEAVYLVLRACRFTSRRALEWIRERATRNPRFLRVSLWRLKHHRFEIPKNLGCLRNSLEVLLFECRE